MLTAEYYAKIQLLGVEMDGYVLSDGTACLSEFGASRLLGFDTHSVLNNLVSNKGPKEIKPLISKELTASQTVLVIANGHRKNSPIKVYTAQTINIIARAYTTAYLQGKLRQNQAHIGLHCATLRNSLADIGLEKMIYESCGYKTEKTYHQQIDQSWQKQATYANTISIIKELGFVCSAPNEIAIKKDIATFLQVPESTLTYFLHKHTQDIKAISLDRATIKVIGLKAPKLHGYKLEDVAKIAIGMDTSIGIDIKKKMFGDIAGFFNVEAKDEVQWQNHLLRVFEGIGIQHNYPIDQYRVDFFIEELMLVLECNGYCHKYYDQAEEAIREKVITEKYGYALVRFHHKISWQALMNGILKAKPGQVIIVYDPADIVK